MSQLDDLKERIKAELPGLECVIGWQQGYDPLHNTPLFIRSAEDVDRLVWGPLNVHNLANYLAPMRGRKVGVVVKGCDSRSVVELLQEKLVDRNNLVVFGMPCSGVVDPAKVGHILEEAGSGPGRIESIATEANAFIVTADGKTHAMAMADVVADKCMICRFPNAVLADFFVGDPLPPAVQSEAPVPDLTALDAMNLLERMSFWRFHMERCIRCHACRNACPLCVCRDQCIAQSRDPHWLSQEDTVTEKLMFQVVHAVHLAGRCTECGECQRACPMGIPVLALKHHMNRVIRELFDYQAGTDLQAVPPLLCFQVDEKNITEGGQ